MVWKDVEDTDPETGETDWDKPPFNVHTGGPASSTNPKTWTDFKTALAAYRRGSWDGIGFVLHKVKGDDGPGLVGIDLDKCRDPDSGSIEPWARKVVEQLRSYTEVSPSGRGLRIFVRAKLPAAGRKKGHFECYETGRYVTVTGQRVEGTPATVESRQAELEAIHASVFKTTTARADSTPRSPQAPTDLDEAELIRKACAARNGDRFRRLWSGDRSGHGSPSEADLALCNYLAFWCGPNEARIAELFAQSGLFRSKWQREDYRHRTIGKALEGRTEFYTPRPKYGKSPPPNGDRHKDEHPSATDIHLTDLGNAQHVISRHGADLHFSHPWKAWLVWDRRRWAIDQTAEAVRRVKETQAELYRQVAEELRQLQSEGESGGEGEDDGRKKQLAILTRLLKHLLAWEDARAMNRCLEQMRSEPGVPVLPEALDRDGMLLNVLNGTIDLRTGTLREHRRQDLLTKLAPVEYNPEAKCPLWLKFLDRSMDRREGLICYLQRVVGYSLTGDVREQILWFFHGPGQNGKSTFLLILLALLGDYAMQAVGELLMEKKNESHPTERADLFGKRFVATIETEEGKRLAEALMKQLTGGDRIRARKMRQDFFEFSAAHKIFLAANHKPNVRGTDMAVWRRIKLVPFTVTIPEKEKDKHLLEKLKGELPGILTWAIKGCLDWQAHGLEEPEEVKKATDCYRAEQDTLACFLAENCNLHRDLKVRVKTLFEAYEEWSGDKLISFRGFNDKLRSMGYEDRRMKTGYWWQGIGLVIPEG